MVHRNAAPAFEVVPMDVLIYVVSPTRPQHSALASRSSEQQFFSSGSIPPSCDLVSDGWDPTAVDLVVLRPTLLYEYIVEIGTLTPLKLCQKVRICASNPKPRCRIPK